VSIHKDDLKNANIPWSVKVETHHGLSEIFEFDLLVVASGLYSEPYIPVFHGQEKFGGSIVHAYDVKTHEQVADKRVIVIGGGKCATDMAVLAGSFAQTCHLIFRRAHWMVPRSLMKGFVPIRLFYTRLFCVPFTPFPGAPHSALFRFVHRKFPHFFANAIKTLSDDIITTHGPDLFNDKIFLPRHAYRNVENMTVIPKDFIRLKRDGRIVGKLASIDKIIDRTTVQLDSGEQLQVDMIIYATGFIERFPFFSDVHARTLSLRTTTTADDDTEFRLYRRIIPVGIPSVAFVGFTSSVANWMIDEVTSHWISEYFLGRLKLPSSEKEMYEEIMATRTFVRQMFNRPGWHANYYWLEPLEIYLNDMGLALHRTNNWISEYFGVYRPERLKGLHEERQAKAEGRPIKQQWYFGFGHSLLVVFLLFFFYSLCYT
jgi:dimethylaniline monooxygenase (N-oxide forming)